jgi:amidase
VSDAFGALIVGPAPVATPTGAGPLDGRTFVVKDVFDVAGHRTGAGNPDVLAAGGPADRHAWAVEALLDAGATCMGKAHTVETAYALSGVNEHYGTPTHPLDHARDPGGSSSGSAVAVASGLVDLALGTDTAGSIRVPASYCGLVGMRPTHGRIPVRGMFPLAPRFDTVGWLTRSGELARRVGSVLFDSNHQRRPRLGRVLVAIDLFGRCDTGHVAEIDEAVRRIAEVTGRSPEPIRFWRDDESERWSRAFRTLQRRDAWATNQGWIESLRPTFGPSIAQRWREAASVTEQEHDAAVVLAALLSERVWELLTGDAVLVLPSAPGVAPLLTADPDETAATRSRLMDLTVISPIAKAPQVSLPLMEFDGLPVGIGLMASPGNDELVLDLAAELVPDE